MPRLFRFNWRSSWRSLLYLGFAVLLTAAPALAQEGESSPVDSPTGQIFRWLNFAIVLGLIFYAFSKVVPFFRQHADEISRKIAEGKLAREAAEKQRRDVEAKLANLDQEIAKLRTEAKRDAELEAQRLRALAKADAEKIERAAKEEIAAAERAASLQLKALTAQLAVARAEKRLRESANPKDDVLIFDRFVKELGSSATGGNIN